CRLETETHLRVIPHAVVLAIGEDRFARRPLDHQRELRPRVSAEEKARAPAVSVDLVRTRHTARINAVLVVERIVLARRDQIEPLMWPPRDASGSARLQVERIELLVRPLRRPVEPERHANLLQQDDRRAAARNNPRERRRTVVLGRTLEPPDVDVALDTGVPLALETNVDRNVFAVTNRRALER